MIGRAAIGYPWIFNEIKHYFNTGEHLAKPTVVDSGAQSPYLGNGMERRAFRDCRDKTSLYKLF
jgi:tRNA-dihydrouridine synthase